MAIPAQECDNCQYPVPQRKKPGQEVQGAYQPAGSQGTDDCSQCFYQPETEKQAGK